MKKLNKEKTSHFVLLILPVTLIFFNSTVVADQKMTTQIQFKTVQDFKKAKPVFELLKIETKGIPFHINTTDPSPVQYGYFAIPVEGKIYEITPAHRVTRVLRIEPWAESKLISLDEFLKNMSKPHL